MTRHYVQLAADGTAKADLYADRGRGRGCRPISLT